MAEGRVFSVRLYGPYDTQRRVVVRLFRDNDGGSAPATGRRRERVPPSEGSPSLALLAEPARRSRREKRSLSLLPV
jgi:hypothetical protein